MINNILKKFNFQLVKISTQINSFPDFENEFNDILKKCKPFTMTSEERLYAMHKAVEYIVKNNIAGDIVECGVWRGGSTMCALLSLKKVDKTNHKVFLYDTFEGMSAPTEKDANLLGKDAQQLLEQSQKTTEDIMWCYAPIEDVKKNIESTGYPAEQVTYVKGKVEDTIPHTMPGDIAILRLDTDWYESTYHELKYLFPKLVKGGVIIIDDYGHWQGAREAVDQYFKENNIHILLSRIDYTGRIGVKM
jgi:O-methyltransferase